VPHLKEQARAGIEIDELRRPAVRLPQTLNAHRTKGRCEAALAMVEHGFSAIALGGVATTPERLLARLLNRGAAATRARDCIYET
jgi:hypothetical protein